MPGITNGPDEPTSPAEAAPATDRLARPLNPAFLLLAGGRLVRERVEAALNLRGTSLRQLAALGHLKAAPGLSYSELGRRAGVTPQSMQATLNQLEAHGAVERRTPSGRGRVAQLHLTPSGVATLAGAEAVVDQISEQVMSALPPGERDGATLMLFHIFMGLTQYEPPPPVSPRKNSARTRSPSSPHRAACPSPGC